jgi:hypothetical protein
MIIICLRCLRELVGGRREGQKFHDVAERSQQTTRTPEVSPGARFQKLGTATDGFVTFGSACMINFQTPCREGSPRRTTPLYKLLNHRGVKTSHISTSYSRLNVCWPVQTNSSTESCLTAHHVPRGWGWGEFYAC